MLIYEWTDLEQYRSKSFFEALRQRRTHFQILSSVFPDDEYSHNKPFIPHLITNPNDSIFGEYTWDATNNMEIIKAIFNLLRKEYQYFKEMKSTDSIKRRDWNHFHSNNTTEWQLQNTIIKNPLPG